MTPIHLFSVVTFGVTLITRCDSYHYVFSLDFSANNHRTELKQVDYHLFTNNIPIYNILMNRCKTCHLGNK